MKKTDAGAQPAAKYTKEQILLSKRFAERRDLLQAILKDEVRYSLEEAGRTIEAYMKGKVN